MADQKIKIEKFVFGGEALGVNEEGQKAFVWNALPGEEVIAETQKKKGTIFGVAKEITTPSVDRIDHKEDHFLSCSPWQILKEEKEPEIKHQVISELFSRQFQIELPDFKIVDSPSYFHYRNKMEFSFYGDETGISLSLYKRGSKGKYKINGCELAKDGINRAAQEIVAILNNTGLRAGDLKSLVIKQNSEEKVIAALFVKIESIPQKMLTNKMKYMDGFSIYFSDPKSPMSVATKLLHSEGEVEFTEKILGNNFLVNIFSFAQVNIPVFEKALKKIIELTKNEAEVVDFYAGSGAIGLSLDAKKVTLVEEIKEAVEAGNKYIAANSINNAEFIHTKAEEALQYLKSKTIIFDPPRSGLHPKVVTKIKEVLPEKIVYLSCNPATQGRDIAELKELYNLEFFEAYNFFPRTPHAETLALLTKR